MVFEYMGMCCGACDCWLLNRKFWTVFDLCRALKTKHDTPKYGLIYHASLVGQTTSKNKGKVSICSIQYCDITTHCLLWQQISRMLAAKTSLAIRYDALGEDGSQEIGLQGRAKIESRLREVEQGQVRWFGWGYSWSQLIG